MESLSQRDSHGFRSRRSHTSLQHISLAPLSSRFPLDDDDEDGGYFSVNHGGAEMDPDHSAYQPHTMTSSYLSSISVPATPSLLSQSRNVSQMNLTKKKRTPQGAPMSESHLDALDVAGPLHHQQPRRHQRTKSHNPRSRKNGASGTTTPRIQDNEWLLRTGLALASSTREEKGQSWLVKRESSTSLVSHSEDGPKNGSRARHDFQGRRSGLSTPVVRSRRGSSSHAASKRSSRVDLAMTPSYSTSHHIHSGAVTPRSRDIPGLVPDFLDQSIREELAALQTRSPEQGSGANHDLIEPDSISLYQEYRDYEYDSDSNEDDSEDEEISEAEVHRLTLERGFGLGSWIDRLVEWTVFGTEDESLQPPTLGSSHWRGQQVNFNLEGDAQAGSEMDPTDKVETASDAGSERSYGTDVDHETLSTAMRITPADSQGGWANDVKWLLRAAGNAVL
ncbi:uncharacterized protein GIQ15_01405 [Arthroderma uncinatum]|uniref:uncharacterized protein n=1 Tax=Arthroderma uncinatum TaxID=74035 RepID=UPI00144A51C8|nr:uncharacterized protein GIQ15_01405 [Arthroderma uncinatum]KAF3491888.1 hypothetical protein GIQ15_01405 [Arthroderma uncinatum]